MSLTMTSAAFVRLRQIGFGETAGKTIQDVAASDEWVVMTFSDGTFAAGHAEISRYDEYAEIRQGIDLFKCSKADMLRLGVLTEQDYIDMDNRRKQVREDADRAYFEELRKRFG